MQKYKIYIIGFLVLFLFGGVMFLYNANSPSSTEDGKNENKDNGIDAVVVPADVSNSIDSVPIPDLDRPVVIPEGMNSESATQAKQKIAELIDTLKSDSALVDHWLELGTYRKLIEDYKGAEEIWSYVAFIQPDDARVFNNLSNLYIYHFHDNQKGEEYILKAIEKAPTNPQYYAAAVELYVDILGDKASARELLQGAITNHPTISAVLQSMLDAI
ncbi:MAG: hypothetical protein Q8O83_00395 [bacterium]|nr:hypothetical protein [bacterium]